MALDGRLTPEGSTEPSARRTGPRLGRPGSARMTRTAQDGREAVLLPFKSPQNVTASATSTAATRCGLGDAAARGGRHASRRAGPGEPRPLLPDDACPPRRGQGGSQAALTDSQCTSAPAKTRNTAVPSRPQPRAPSEGRAVPAADEAKPEMGKKRGARAQGRTRGRGRRGKGPNRRGAGARPNAKGKAKPRPLGERALNAKT